MNQEIKWSEDDIVGQILPSGKIEKEFYMQGFIYKNPKAFFEKTDEVCYVPEYSSDSLTDKEGVDENYKYTYKDFVRISQKFIDDNEDVQEYCQKNDMTAEDVAVNLFEFVDWQAPETLIDDWENNGTYTWG